jgi:RecB family exonuclease
MTTTPQIVIVEGEESLVGERLSVSQVSKFQDCSAAWAFEKVCGLQPKPSAKAAFGSAGHAALQALILGKVSGVNYTPLQVDDLATHEFERAFADAQLEDSDRPMTLAAELRKQVSMFVERRLPEIEPLTLPSGEPAVEVELEGVIGGVRVSGRADLIEETCVTDFKFTSRKSSGFEAKHRLQLGIYAELATQMGIAGSVQERNGDLVVSPPDVRIDQFVRTKTPQFVPLPGKVDAADMAFAHNLLPIIQEQMQTGRYAPNRSAMYCSHSSCSFARECEKKFGGHVKGGDSCSE